MADGSPTTIEEIVSDKYLEKARQRGDTLADGIVQQVADSHGGISRVRQLLADLAMSSDVADVAQADGAAGDGIRAILDDFLTQSGRLPEWAEEKKIRKAQTFFQEHGFVAFLLLGAACLPELYTCGNGGTQVLDVTHALVEGAKRRIHQTAHIITSVMTPGGLKDAASPGVRAVQKVRLMHACVRFLALAPASDAPPDPQQPTLATSPQAYQRLAWDNSWGVPIGQEYMAGTLQTFSYVILRGMRDLNIISKRVAQDPRPDSESACYIHAWNVVGHILGVEEAFLQPIKTYAASGSLFNRVMDRNIARTPAQKKAGLELTSALTVYITSLMDLNGMKILGLVPSLRLPERIPKYLIRKMIGRRRARLLLTFDPLDRPLYHAWNVMTAFALRGIVRSRFRKLWREALAMVISEEMCRLDPGGCPYEFMPPKHLHFLWSQPK